MRFQSPLVNLLITRTGIISYVFELIPGHCFKSYLPLNILNYGVSKHYAGSQMSDRCPLGYLFVYLNQRIHFI